MAQSQIRQPSQEELLRALTAGQEPFDQSVATKGVIAGEDLASTILKNKQGQEDRLKKLAEEIQKAKKQRALVTANEPAPTTKTLRELIGKQPTPVAPHAPTEDLSGVLSIPPASVPNLEFDRPKTAITNVRPKEVSRDIPLTADEQVVAENSRQQNISEKAIDLSPEVFAKEKIESMFPKASTSGERFQQGSAELNGQIVNVVFDKSTGRYQTPDGNKIEGSIVRGFKPDIRIDPATEQLIRVLTSGKTAGIGGQPTKRDEQGSIVEVTDPQDLTVRQSNRMNELRKNYEDDDVVKSNRITLNTLNNLKTVQAQGTGAVIGSLQSLRARGLAGEKGVLTEQDVIRTTGSPELTRRFMNAFLKLTSGQESPENVAEFNAAARAVEDAAVARNVQTQQDFIRRARATKELQPVSDDLIRSNIDIGTKKFNMAGDAASRARAILEERRKKGGIFNGPR